MNTADAGAAPCAARGEGAVLAGVRALVFDFDGTLATASYDFGAMRLAVRRAAAEYGLGEQALDGLGILEAIECAAQLLGAQGQAFRQRSEAAVREDELNAAATGRLMPGAAESLRRLMGAGYRVGVISRNCRAAIDVILRGAELPCHAVLARDDVRLAKPHPEHLLRALAAIGATPGQALMVGDHSMDMQAGKALNMRSVGVLTGSCSAAELEQAGADLLVADTCELAAMLLRGA